MSAAASLAEGTKLAGFTVVGEIGRGGMGVVYLAEQASLGRRVALKVINPQLADDPEFRERFEREAHHAASIDHPNVIPIFEAGTDREYVYIAMRYVEGEDLGSVIKREGPLDENAAARVVEQVAAALDAAHAKGLVHRDVKPANVLLDRGDPGAHAYLTDFGLTKEQAAMSGLTSTGAWVGTIDYVPPEQIDGRQVEARSDVYSLGCVLYEALTGEIPFQGVPTQKLWAHMSNPPPSLADVRPDVAAEFDPVVKRALAKDLEDRYPSAGDLGRAARAATHGAEIATPERSVATGVAAGASGSPTAPSSEEPTRTIQAGSVPPTVRREPPPPRRDRRGRRSWFAAAAIAAALLAGAGAAAVVATQFGGDSDQGTGGERSTNTGPDGEGPGPDPSTGEFPGGSGFTAILASETSKAEAEAVRSDAAAEGLDPGILFSSDYSSLRPGFWVVYSGSFDSESEATAQTEAAQAAGFGDAYTREVVP